MIEYNPATFKRKSIDRIYNLDVPVGWRLPTEAELEAERLSWVSNDSAGAFASPLKLTVAGYRAYDDGSLIGVGSEGLYWSSNVDGTYSWNMYFYDTTAVLSGNGRAYGGSIRLIKQEGLPLVAGDQTFTYNGAPWTYREVESAGRIWMDRNLGVTPVLTTLDDWYLPAIDEVIEYDSSVLGGLPNLITMSSTEHSATQEKVLSGGWATEELKVSQIFFHPCRTFYSELEYVPGQSILSEGVRIFDRIANGIGWDYYGFALYTDDYTAPFTAIGLPADDGIMSVGHDYSNIIDVAIGASAQSLTDGQPNTSAIIAQAGHATSAALWCDGLTITIGAHATAFDDVVFYGDLFQWGRNDDGHQLRTSGTTSTLSNSDTPGHGDFITTSVAPYDWRNPQNDNLWQL